MEQEYEGTREYTHKVVDLGNGGLAIFWGSKQECEDYLKRNQLKTTDLVICDIYNII